LLDFFAGYKAIRLILFNTDQKKVRSKIIKSRPCLVRSEPRDSPASGRNPTCQAALRYFTAFTSSPLATAAEPMNRQPSSSRSTQ
jgi:hypothetical protein